MGNFDVLVLTPARTGDPSIAIAACRAGARGFLDLEHDSDLLAGGGALDHLARFSSGGFGVKLGPTGGALLPILVADGSQCREVILAGGERADWGEWIAILRRRQIRVFAESVSIAEARRAAELDIDGIILKGHESGGRIGADTTFILLQRWRAAVTASEVPDLPVYAQGGIGLHTASACIVAGASGVVLDNQLLLSRESPLSESARKCLETFDGSETRCVADGFGGTYRCWTRPDFAAPLSRDRKGAGAEPLPYGRGSSSATASPASEVWLIGQDAAFAKTLAERYRTVGGIVQAIRQSVADHIAIARRLSPLAADSSLAQRHGTRYPIVQGPMTRVSDTAAFAESVATNGGLPFLALALLRRDETEKLLRQTSERLSGRPWGAGILGFAPPEIRREQTEAIRAIRPPFALIAGGRPDQARELENEGIPTYLHVPSPRLLSLFLRDGARRFVFEGRECGGHVGPRSSFVLWELMCELLLEQCSTTTANAAKPGELHVLFAGGIHDALSSAMVAALSAPLAERGVHVGVLVGTAYLFTEEAVAANAIVPRYQQEALRCRETVLLETGPGHAIRCIATSYAETFEQEKRRLQAQGRKPDEIREALETLNVGRLRVASKGIDRPVSGTNGSSHFVEVAEDEQVRRGMYMIGQAGTLRQGVVTMKHLHEDISTGGTHLLQTIPAETERSVFGQKPSDIAIIGMACFLPGANDARTYWQNVLNRVNAVTEVPLDHWDWRLYYDANPKARDKICSKWGGFLADMPFDPLLFGMPPNSLTSIEPVQLYALEAVRRALADAGYEDRPFDRERTAVILGAGGGAAQLAISYSFRSYLPMLATVPGLKDAAEILRKAEKVLPEWTEDSFPGILINVIAGRVANRFNFGGPNFSIDAACGSSLAALYAGVRELEMGTSDTAVVLGADTVQNPYTYMAFSKTHAFSQRGRCSTFDEAADGIVISEGVVAVILKRLADAERDGDRIYAVIKGIGASSDGRDKGLTAPRPEGQLRALQRAYDKANLSPARVEFVEAHGTGTVVGDQTEVASLGRIMRESGAAARSCAIGSVKSMIGHTKCAAGLAGLVNATLALHHKVLPPLLVEKPNTKAKFEDSPFFLNTQPRPWVHGGSEPRVAGVSAFGFGGTNFHAVLEEYTGDYLARTQPAMNCWPAELFVWRRPSADAIASEVQSLRDALKRGTAPNLADLAYSLSLMNLTNRDEESVDLSTLAIVADSLDDLKQKLDSALSVLRSANKLGHDPRGVFFAASSKRQQGDRIAFLFPGQGSQYPNMLAQLAMAFPEVRQCFDEAEAVLAGRLERPLGKYIFPPSAFTPEQEKQGKEALTRTDVAQPALGAASMGMFRLLGRLGVHADLFAGHSYGDYAALCAAGAMSVKKLIRLSHERGRIILEATDKMPGAMAAIESDADTVAGLLNDLDGVMAANLNSPNQTVISGTEEGIGAALDRFQKHGIRGQRIPVACAFHSPLVAAAGTPFGQALASYSFTAPQTPVYSNTTAAPYPVEPTSMVELLRQHLASPVRFRDEIEAMYAAGARVFVEVGPQGVLTALVGQTLADRPHLAVASDLKGRPGLVQFQHLLAQLVVHGVPVQLERLYEGRNLRRLDLSNLDRECVPVPASPSTWLVNSVRVRPLHGPEPRLLGQASANNLEPVKETASRPTPEKPKVTALPVMKPIPTPPTSPAPSTNGSAHGNGVHHPHAANGVENKLPLAAIPGDEAAQVMLRFQDLMSRFLDTQRSVMVSYLQGGQPPTSAPSLPTPVLHTTNGHDSNGHGANGHASQPTQPLPAPVSVEPLPLAVPQKEETKPVPEATGPDRDTVTARLLDIVCKRTGYPTEMLGLDLDLEADLGIDSIKRVEILGMLADANGGQMLNVSMEKLSNIKTLRGIIDCISDAENSTNPSPSPSASDGTNSSAQTPRASIQRMLVTAVDAPSIMENNPVLPGGTILLTDDGGGIAAELAQRLRALGQQVAFVSTNPGENVVHADLTSPRAVEELIAQIHSQYGPISGLIHLLPLAQREGQSWVERLQLDVKSLFLLARGLADELQKAAETGNALLLAATGMGGSFGSGVDAQLADDFSPGQGGVAGLIKSLAHEWPNVLVRVVDVDRGARAELIAGLLLAELGDTTGPIEIGYQEERRLTLQCVASPLNVTAHTSLPLGRDSTVLLTGGARGITAAVALELAHHYQPNLILVGRSPLPEDSEGSDTAGITGAAELKAAVIERLRREGRPASPASVESAYQRLHHDREIRRNIERLKEAGARVHYYQADVRDDVALSAVIDDVYRRFGAIDGVIHGAGVIQDKLIRDKTPESYDRVFGTKVESALILSRRLNFERLKFCVFFASVAGRFGNRGQADYAAANEVLSKLAVSLDRRWPARVVSIAWGPWSTIGMVSELEKHLGQRGLQMIPPEVGPQFLDEELRLGRKGECEVVIAGDVGQLACPRRAATESVR